MSSALDLLKIALKACGAFGVGRDPGAEDITDAKRLLNGMLAEWQRQRFMVWQLAEYVLISTGAASYTLGPGGDFDTGAAVPRPDRLEDAFMRQVVASGLQVDFPLEVLQAREDYNQIAVKGLVSFPQYVYYQPSFPLAEVHFYPVPNATIYELHLFTKQQLAQVTDLAATLLLPLEYENCIIYNLALRLRVLYPLAEPIPQDQLPALARNSRQVLKEANAQIPRLRLPVELSRPGIYNIYSDRTY